jgi:polyisoprenyl-phosphate glycosyltransferase
MEDLHLDQKNNLQLSVVVPVYNASPWISELCSELVECCSGTGYSFEIILVDDRSTDDSWNQIQMMTKKHPKIVSAIRLARNFGQHNATLAGLSVSIGEWVVTIDDDFESSPGDIPRMVSLAMKKKSALTYAEYTPRFTGIMRYLFTSFYKRLAKLEGKLKGRGSSFRVIRRDLVDQLNKGKGYFVFIDEMCLWNTSDIQFIPLQRGTGKRPRSAYSFFRLLNLTGDVIMYSSTLPLKMVTWLGFWLASVNFLLGVFFLIKKVFFNAQVGYTSTIISILFSTGLIILCLGIISEYMAKVVRNVQGAPSFFIEDRI